ncbi:MAG: helix-turn-helix domain-containing protein [Candidatus Omnitrophica bacterium]|nr:helix-turn-helix domain-containing protein [Candidatus Omnitrophota bacterium]
MKKKTIAKKKNGRPSKFDSINLNQVKKLVLKGFTDKEIADFLEINQDTFHEWKKKHSGFSESLKDWKDEADHVVERSLYERAKGYRTTYRKNFVVSDGKEAGSHLEQAEEEVVFPPDSTSCIFWLKNRKQKQWRDKVVGVIGDADDDEFCDEFFGFKRKKKDTETA